MLVAADCSSHQDLPVVTTSGRQAQSLLLLPPPFIAHRISVFKEKDFSPVWCSHWENASRAYRCGDAFFRWPWQLVLFPRCASELVGRRFPLLGWLVGTICCRKGAESWHHCRQRGLQARRPSRLPPTSLQCCGETVCPGALSPQHLSAKHNTNLFPQPSVQVPLFISRRTQIPVASRWLPLSFFLLSLPPCSFPPLVRVTLADLTLCTVSGLWRQRLRAQRQPWVRWCKYVQLPHCSGAVWSIFPVSFAVLMSIVWEKLFRFYFYICGNKT